MSSSWIFVLIRMEAPVTITMYLGSTTTSEFELASLDYSNSSYSSQTTTASGKYISTTCDQTGHISESAFSNQETNLKTIKNVDAEGRPENLCSKLENLIEFFNNIWQLQHKISYLYKMKGYNQKIYSDSYLVRESWWVKKPPLFPVTFSNITIAVLPYRNVMQLMEYYAC